MNLRNVAKLSDKFLATIVSYHIAETKNNESYSVEELKEIKAFTKFFLNTFTNKEFIIPDKDLKAYILFNATITNLIYLAELKVDNYIELLSNSFEDLNTLVKILTLYTPKSIIKLDYFKFFEINKDFASIWYWSYFKNSDLTTKNSYENLTQHLQNFKYIQEKLVIPNVSDYKSKENSLEKLKTFSIKQIDLFADFFATYINQEEDKILKLGTNNLVKEKVKNIVIKNTPNKKKIAIISTFFYENHSVHRGVYNYIKALANDYDLTLISFAPHPNKDPIFKKEIRLSFKNFELDLTELNNNDYIMAYFADPSLSTELTLLANLRIAPIQVAGLGHSTSSWSSELDYFITGVEVEDLSLYKKNYSEKPILISGMGVSPTLPNYQRKNITEKKDYFSIIASWSYAKINYEHLINLKKIIALSSKKLKFHFFICESKKLSFSIFKKGLEEVLGAENVLVYQGIPYQKYMEIIEKSDLSIDSFHFGGCNTAIDSLYLYKPYVAYQGTKAYNRFSSAALKSLHLEELIASNSTEYIKKVLELINNDDYRLSIVEKLKQVNFETTLFSTKDTINFKKAIDFLVANYDKKLEDLKFL
jgi:predicted O-linked N-acetylglucosamine transferase (SPINDLY family)